MSYLRSLLALAVCALLVVPTAAPAAVLIRTDKNGDEYIVYRYTGVHTSPRAELVGSLSDPPATVHTECDAAWASLPTESWVEGSSRVWAVDITIHSNISGPYPKVTECRLYAGPTLLRTYTAVIQ